MTDIEGRVPLGPSLASGFWILVVATRRLSNEHDDDRPYSMAPRP